VAGGRGRYWYPPPSRPRPADGIRARSRRGDIAQTWWSRRFIDILESFPIAPRLRRGRTYARRGQVLALEVVTGEVRASVQGSRAKPYVVRLGVLTLAEKDWSRAEDAIASRAIFAAKLLAGEMPRDIEDAFADCHLSLLPSSPRDLSSDCSCPDWSNPCKHVAAVYYLLAEAFDDDPFLIFRWRGRDRDELLARLRSRRGGAADEPPVVPAVKTATLRACIPTFWDAGEALEAPPPRPVAAEAPHGILIGLERPAIEVEGRNLADVLVPAYTAIAAAAERRALGGEDGEPSLNPAPGPARRGTRRAASSEERPADTASHGAG
jgi:uncharacterized Zn finger protein